MTGHPDLLAAVLAADRRIRPDALRTPLLPSETLAHGLRARVLVKYETDQVTGSFKFRGALNKLRALSPEDRARGLVSASTGNHGLAVARAARQEGLDLKLFLPKTVDPDKRRKLEAAGVPVDLFGESCEATELFARGYAGTTGRVFVSPYNDAEIIAGQGTIGMEIAAELPGVQDVLVPVGGGGLAAGIAAALRADGRAPRILGVEPENSANMSASLRAGTIVSIVEKPTVADAVAGGIEPDAVTFPLCRDLLDGVVTVPEAAILRAMTLLRREHGRLVEGAGALAAAAVLADPAAFQGRTVVCVASGGNVTAERFERLTAGA